MVKILACKVDGYLCKECDLCWYGEIIKLPNAEQLLKDLSRHCNGVFKG